MTAAPADILDPDVPFNQRLLLNDLQKSLSQLEGVNIGPIQDLIMNACLSVQDDDLTSDDRIGDLKEVFRGLIQQQQRLDNHKQALLRFASQIDSIPHHQLCKPDYNWTDPLADTIKQIGESKRSLQAQELDRKLAEFHQEITGSESCSEQMEVDEDIIIEKEEEYTKCPITQGSLDNAMKSTKCGHKYSKSGIDSLLTRRPVMPCPVSGCKQTVSRDCLRRCTRKVSQKR